MPWNLTEGRSCHGDDARARGLASSRPSEMAQMVHLVAVIGPFCESPRMPVSTAHGVKGMGRFPRTRVWSGRSRSDLIPGVDGMFGRSAPRPEFNGGSEHGEIDGERPFGVESKPDSRSRGGVLSVHEPAAKAGWCAGRVLRGADSPSIPLGTRARIADYRRPAGSDPCCFPDSRSSRRDGACLRTPGRSCDGPLDP